MIPNRSLVSLTILSFLINTFALDKALFTVKNMTCPFQVPNCDCLLIKKVNVINQNDKINKLSLTCKKLGDDFESIRFLKILKSYQNDKNALYELKIMESNFTIIPWDGILLFKNINFLSLTKGSLTYLTPFPTLEGSKRMDLHTFNISNNIIENIDVTAFLGMHIINLDLSHNYLEEIEEGLFDSQDQLHYLSLASNKIKSLPPFIFQNLSNLEILDISFNYITELMPDIFYPLKNLQALSLAYNRLTMISNDFSFNKNLSKLNLTGNPWHCNESISWISSIPQSIGVNLKELICTTPESLANYLVSDALTIHKLWESINATNTCQVCRCEVNKGPKKVTVDCKGKGLSMLPPRLPASTRVVHLENNLLSRLNMNHVNSTEWGNVIYLNLSNNSLNSLNDIEGTILVTNLVALYLSHNKFQEISIHVLERFTQLMEVTLSKNPWECNCDTIRFQTWLQDHHKQVKDIHELYCGSSHNPALQAKPIFRLAKSDLCSQQAPSLINYLDILNPILALLILAIVSKLCYDIYRHRHTGKFPVFWSFKLR